MKIIWKIGFWGAILAIILRYFFAESFDEEVLRIGEITCIFLFLILWGYAFHKVYLTKGILKKVFLLFVVLIFSALAGWVMYFYDHYHINSDIKRE